jgi:hypothetical protein
VTRLIPVGRRDLSDIRGAVEASKRLQQAMLKHRGFRPITDKEIRAAKQEGRRCVKASSPIAPWGLRGLSRRNRVRRPPNCQNASQGFIAVDESPRD